jgi:hypothetical protein
MTQKRYKDNTRALRDRRREAILNAAARRMGFTSWRNFGSHVRAQVEPAQTDFIASENLRFILNAASNNVREGKRGTPPADIIAALDAFPARKPGRPRRVA